MVYRELIKNFEKIRDYIRDFYVYGFKNREEYNAKSARSYDNERRRMESWLVDYMFCRQSPEGKSVFLLVDCRSVSRNPLYNAFYDAPKYMEHFSHHPGRSAREMQAVGKIGGASANQLFIRGNQL